MVKRLLMIAYIHIMLFIYEFKDKSMMQHFEISRTKFLASNLSDFVQCSDDYSGKFWAHKKILILLYQVLNWNSPSVPHDSFIDTQNFMQLVSMDISMKKHQFAYNRQALIEFECYWTLNSLLNLHNQRNWLNKCNFCLMTLSFGLLFVVILLNRFFDGNK